MADGSPIDWSRVPPEVRESYRDLEQHMFVDPDRKPLTVADMTSWPGLCRFDLGATSCNLTAGHEGRHDPAPMPDPHDHDPDWALHPGARRP